MLVERSKTARLVLNGGFLFGSHFRKVENRFIVLVDHGKIDGKDCHRAVDNVKFRRRFRPTNKHKETKRSRSISGSLMVSARARTLASGCAARMPKKRIMVANFCFWYVVVVANAFLRRSVELEEKKWK